MDKTIFDGGRRTRGSAAAKAEPSERDRAEIDAENEQEMERRRKELDAEEREREMADKYDLAAMHKAGKFPLRIALWNILVEMVRPASRFGSTGLYKTPGQLQAEEYLAKIGKVVACGPSALQGKTESGIELKYLCEGVETPEQLVGLYVVQQPYTGSDIWFTPLPGKKLKLITATEILAVTDNPTMFMKP